MDTSKPSEEFIDKSMKSVIIKLIIISFMIIFSLVNLSLSDDNNQLWCGVLTLSLGMLFPGIDLKTDDKNIKYIRISQLLICFLVSFICLFNMTLNPGSNYLWITILTIVLSFIFPGINYKNELDLNKG